MKISRRYVLDLSIKNNLSQNDSPIADKSQICHDQVKIKAYGY